jgi:capsid protein
VWERFVRLAVLTGELPARDFDRDPAVYLGCEWLPPKFDYVDPMKDVQAEIMAIGAGLKSRTQAISERGYDAEQVDAEIAADQERATALGLGFSRAKRIPTEAVNA